MEPAVTTTTAEERPIDYAAPPAEPQLKPPEADKPNGKDATGAEKEPGEAQTIEQLPAWQKALLTKNKEAVRELSEKLARSESERLMALQIAQQAQARNLPAEQQRTPAPAQQGLVEPDPDSFDDIDAYNAAKKNYDREVTRVEVRAELAQQEAEKRIKASFDGTRKAHDDYELLLQTTQAPVSNEMKAAILDSANPGEVHYFLLKNPEVAARMAVMGERAVVREVGRIEARLEAQAAPPAAAAARQVSQAPAPVERVGANNQVAKRYRDMEWSEFKEQRRKEVAARNHR